MNRTAGWAIAAVGVVLALVAIWIDSLQGSSYWSDGTTGVFLLIVAGIAGLGLLAEYAGGHAANGERDQRLAQILVQRNSPLALSALPLTPAALLAPQQPAIAAPKMSGFCRLLYRN